MKVLLINAPIPDIRGEGLGLVEVVSPPLGISYIAAVLEQEGVEVELCDAQNLNMSFDDIARDISEFNPDIIGISCFTPNYPQAQQVAELAKHVAPEALTVIGGPHVTFTAARTLKETPFIDVVVRGEGEYTMLDLVKAAEGELEVTAIPGISYRWRNRFVNNPDRPFIEDLDSLPFPARHLWPEEYISRGMKEVPVITSRGCPYGCVFCSTSRMAGRSFRARSPENVVNELQQVVEEYDFTRFVFNDDTFTLNQQRVLDICSEIQQRGLNITWACSARVDTVTPELLSRISEAGCNMIYYGVESGNQQILDHFIGKRITLEQAKNAIKWAHDAGIATVASYIIGFPGERLDRAYLSHLKSSAYQREDHTRSVEGTVFESLVRAEELDSDLAQVHLLTPYPGTRIYDEPEKLGIKILTDDFTRYNLQLPIIETNTMNVREMWEAFLAYMNEFDTYNSTRTQRRLRRLRARKK